jgi:broad specificity phosphatase PhoE
MPGPSTVVLIRHAEPQTSGTDPGLTAAGRKRAELLGFMFQDAGVTAVFTSERRRAQETAQPLAARISIAPTVLLGLDTTAHRDRILAPPLWGSTRHRAHKYGATTDRSAGRWQHGPNRRERV